MMPPPAAPPMMKPEDVPGEVAKVLPEPERGFYSYRKVEKIAKAATLAMAAVLGKHAKFPPIVCPPNPGKGDKLMGKLPLDVMVPVLLLIDAAVSTGGPAGQRYLTDPATLVDDSALDMLLAKLHAMAKDKALIKVISSHAEPDADQKGGKPDGDMDDAGMPPAPPPKGAAAYL